MVVRRFTGYGVGAEKPELFRTKGGNVFASDTGKIESLFSRKDETANLEAVRQQHSSAVQNFDCRYHSYIYITNNSPYIFRLNNGWSAQTPSGFFERALPAAVKAVVGAWRFKEVR